MDIWNKIFEATEGKVGPADMLAYAKQAGPMSGSLDPEGMMTIATLIQTIGGLTMAHADSLERQRNAEIAYCTDETNQRASRTTPALDRVQECLRTNGWLPGSGNPKVLPRDFVDRVNRAFTKDGR
jgi:hypothetical protein